MNNQDQPKYLSKGLYEGYKNSLGLAVMAYRQGLKRGERLDEIEKLDRRQQSAACLTDLWLRLSKEFNNESRHQRKNPNRAEDGGQ